MHLDRVFLHVQLASDQLVGLALAQKIDYRKLTRREVPTVRSPLPFTFGLVIRLCGCRAQRIRRNKGATRADKPERRHRNFAVGAQAYKARLSFCGCGFPRPQPLCFLTGKETAEVVGAPPDTGKASQKRSLPLTESPGLSDQAERVRKKLPISMALIERRVNGFGSQPNAEAA
jgi:hypothetical protein